MPETNEGGAPLPDLRIKELPLLPIRGVLVFPYMVIHLDVGRERSMAAINRAMMRDHLIFLAMQKETQAEEPSEEGIYSVGTVAEIKQLLKLPGGTVRILVEGLGRAKIIDFISTEPYFEVLVEEPDQEQIVDQEVEALVRAVLEQFERYVKLSKKVPPETMVGIVGLEDPGQLADVIASHLNLKLADRQALLEAVRFKDRLELLLTLLAQEMEVLELERRINVQVRKQMEKTQKEYYLREQMKAIQKELGEKDEREAEVEELRRQIAEAKLPKEVEEKVLKEVERLEKMPPMVAETTVVRNYLDWMLSLPWSKQTRDRLDLELAERILHEDHYGLDEVKERILEYLAIRKLAKKMKGPILCFVGAPGVGKTSLAKSIARAMERKFVRISLGGIRDEAEIRGHRRTYVGAMPGRIIQGMKQAGSKNPVFLLDEIDKVGTDFRGDPTSALLEVLDPEQNNSFSDHYIEAPFDLSKVLFITTANVMYTIPRPLLDRMEVITLPGYTEHEKLEIAKRHLVPKQIKEHGLKAPHLQLSDNALRKIIREYTREAGVRNLEREIAQICRKVARDIVTNKSTGSKVSNQKVETYLGVPRFRYGVAESEDQVGVATGLAWTEVGGDVLSVEATLLRGKGNITLTGKLGEVMKESAYAGLTYVRSRAGQLAIPEDFYEKYDLHIHVPEGAIPKDGPSAGITMATAMVSALTGRPVRRDVAMTGEVTLRGRVLPIGGVKEKILAAHRAGIKTVILPRENEKNLEDIPLPVRRKMEFVLAGHMDEVLATALVGGLTPGKAPEELLQAELVAEDRTEVYERPGLTM
ncbi:MAG: endopeptidase La [Clostridia bacterium]|nr:MAG: endopeptidase La [Clostridia bacterium]